MISGDTIIAETVTKNNQSFLQNYVDEFARKSQADRFQLNETKCVELHIRFSKLSNVFEPIVINDNNIEVVSSVKLLGLIISDVFIWNAQVSDICKKVSSRLHISWYPKSQYTFPTI